jgi:cell migration-inducing and hyaluronan-binding protein
VIEDSLVVGESGNKGNPDDWEARGLDGRELPYPWAPEEPLHGLQFYDGPMGIRGVLFANLVPNKQRPSGALTSLAPNKFNVSPQNWAEDVHFLNAKRVFLHTPTKKYSGDAFSVFHDRDGSVTGTAGSVVVPRNPVLLTKACSLHHGWNAYVCPRGLEYVNLWIYAHGDHPSGTVLSRGDGARMAAWGVEDDSDQVNVSVLADTQYALTFPKTTPKHLSLIVPSRRSGAVRVSMPYRATGLSVTLWGQPIERARTAAALGSGGHKYYYDAAAGRLFVRIGPGTSYEEIEIQGK